MGWRGRRTTKETDELPADTPIDADNRALLDRTASGDVAAAVLLVEAIGGPLSDLAIEALSTLLDEMDARALARLASGIRARGSWRGLGWRALSPKDARRLMVKHGHATPVAALLSMHPNGYIREASVRALTRDPNSLAVGALVLRCADWVPEVRDLAVTAVDERLQTGHADIIPWLPLLVADRSPRLEVVRQGVAQRIATMRDEELAAQFEQADPYVRRYLARLLRSVHRAPTPTVWHAVLRQDDAPTASILLGYWLDSEAPITLAEIAVTSRVPSVRAAAVWRLGQSARPDHLEMVESALFDASGSVRRTAQTAARDRGVDPALIYRELIDAQIVRASGVLGLAETGTPNDADVLVTLLDDPSPAVRTAITKGLGRFPPRDSVLDALVRLLRDPSPRVAKAASRSLLSSVRSIPDDHLWADVDEADLPPHTAGLAFRLLASPDVWRGLDASLRVLTTGPASLQEAAVERVGRMVSTWAATSHRPPSPDQRRRIADNLSSASEAFGSRQAELLAFSLRPWLG